MNFNSTKRYSVTQRRSSTGGGGGGGASILDQAYGPAWLTDSVNGRSARVIYNQFQLIGYVPGNIAYQNSIGGDDATAVLGNVLRPFRTIGAAITAIGVLTNSAIYCSAGYNMLDDSNAHYGLKSPNSNYDLWFESGCTVDYYGTYGLYISDNSTAGNIYGRGTLIANGAVYTGAVDGVSNYAFNISAAAVKFVELYDLKRESTSNAANLLRIGACVNTGINFNISGRIQERGGWCITAAANSRAYFERVNYLVNTSNLCGLIRLTDVVTFGFNNLLQSAAYGNFTGLNQTRAVIITDTTGSSSIEFNQCAIIATLTTNGAYALIELVPPASGLMPNLQFKNCTLKNRQNSSLASTGVSFYSASNVSFKIIDTYTEKNVGGAGVITNIIGSGNGLMQESNL